MWIFLCLLVGLFYSMALESIMVGTGALLLCVLSLQYPEFSIPLIFAVLLHKSMVDKRKDTHIKLLNQKYVDLKVDYSALLDAHNESLEMSLRFVSRFKTPAPHCIDLDDPHDKEIA